MAKSKAKTAESEAKTLAALAKSVKCEGEAIAMLICHRDAAEIAAMLGVALAYALQHDDEDNLNQAAELMYQTALAGGHVYRQDEA